MRAGHEAAGSVPHPRGWGQDSGPCRLSPDLATQAEAGPRPRLQDGHTWKGPSPACPWLGMRKMLITEHADSHKDTKTKGTFPLGDNSYPEHSLHSRPGMLLSPGGRSNTTTLMLTSCGTETAPGYWAWECHHYISCWRDYGPRARRGQQLCSRSGSWLM